MIFLTLGTVGVQQWRFCSIKTETYGHPMHGKIETELDGVWQWKVWPIILAWTRCMNSLSKPKGALIWSNHYIWKRSGSIGNTSFIDCNLDPTITEHSKLNNGCSMLSQRLWKTWRYKIIDSTQWANELAFTCWKNHTQPLVAGTCLQNRNGMANGTNGMSLSPTVHEPIQVYPCM